MTNDAADIMRWYNIVRSMVSRPVRFPSSSYSQFEAHGFMKHIHSPMTEPVNGHTKGEFREWFIDVVVWCSGVNSACC